MFDEGISAERAELVTTKLREFNQDHSAAAAVWDDPRFTPSPVQVYVLDPAGGVVGGLLGRAHTVYYWKEL